MRLLHYVAGLNHRGKNLIHVQNIRILGVLIGNIHRNAYIDDVGRIAFGYRQDETLLVVEFQLQSCMLTRNHREQILGGRIGTWDRRSCHRGRHGAFAGWLPFERSRIRNPPIHDR